MFDKFEDELDAIRVRLYEQTKGMSNADAARAINEQAREIGSEFGIQIVQAVSHDTERQQVIGVL